MSMSRNFMWDISVNTRNHQSSGLFGTSVNKKLEKRTKEYLLINHKRQDNRNIIKAKHNEKSNDQQVRKTIEIS